MQKVDSSGTEHLVKRERGLEAKSEEAQHGRAEEGAWPTVAMSKKWPGK